MVYLKTVNGRAIPDRASHSLTFSYNYQNKTSLQRLVDGGGTILKDTLVFDENGDTHFVEGKISKPKDAFIYKDFAKNYLRIQQTLGDETSAIKDTIPVYPWEFHDETKEILGYTCQKATTIKYIVGVKQNITAWYTEDIPVNDGPSDFNGLPGMILELHRDDRSFSRFESIQFLAPNNTALQEPNDTVPALTYRRYNMIYRRKY